MARTFTSVDEYMASQPQAVQGPLERVRRTIRKALPGAEEVISYGIDRRPREFRAKEVIEREKAKRSLRKKR